MDAAAVFRLITLIPDRMPRSPSGSAFDGAGSGRAELLSRFMAKGLPDTTLFKTIIGDVIDTARAAGRYRKVRVYGEMVNLLWKQNLPAVTRLEELWNDVLQAHSISLVCAYCLDRNGEAQRQFPPDLRAAHSHLIPVEACA